jgi:hypothetical protein
VLDLANLKSQTFGAQKGMILGRRASARAASMGTVILVRLLRARVQAQRSRKTGENDSSLQLFRLLYFLIADASVDWC